MSTQNFKIRSKEQGGEFHMESKRVINIQAINRVTFLIALQRLFELEYEEE